MQRPLMDPTFLPDVPTKTRPPKVKLWRRLLRQAVRPLKVLAKVLFYKPWHREPTTMLAGGSPGPGRSDFNFHRFCRSLLYRLLFVPVLLVLALAAIVYAGTHPRQSPSDLDPSSEGVYYDAVSFLSDDGVRLEGWLIPVLEPKLVVKEKDKILKLKSPGVVLVHDVGSQRHQMLPLVRPLHDAGVVVLVVNLRGCGASGQAGVTFGLREALDVKAAVQTLRSRVYVDDKRIAVVGVGTGASAALLAAAEDPQITALVLDHPALGAQQVVNDFIGPRVEHLRWMQPLAKWAFEMSYQVDADDLEMSRLAPVMKSRPVLMFDQSKPGIQLGEIGSATKIRDFLQKTLKSESTTASAR
jgi:pimeloyl-ACP methyl ester carboxylesterase